MRVPILSGIKTDAVGDFRVSLPRNMVPVPLSQGISQGYLRPADGITPFALGQGEDRRAIVWNGECYRVSGSKLIRVDAGGNAITLGDVGAGGTARMDYSSDRLAITSGGRLYYLQGGTLTQVTDPDLGQAHDVLWMDGYFLTTDGTFIVQTELADPTSIEATKYGSSEADPDPIQGLRKIIREMYAVNRFTIEAFENVGGTGFAFQRIESAQVSRGAIGRSAFCVMLDTIFFLGGGRLEGGVEPPSIYAMTPGSSVRVATREIDTILSGYTEAELSEAVLEPRIEKGHALLYVHLPNQTLAYDVNASKLLSAPVWHTLDSGLVTPAQYRARNFVWCYDRWIAGDPSSSAIGAMSQQTMEHHGAALGWEFGTLALYAGGDSGIVVEMELVGLPGRVSFGEDPVIWASYSHDGETWSQEHAISCGKQGERGKRMAWRKQGKIRHYRMQKFRGTSDARVSFAALEMQIEPLSTRSGNG